MYTNKVSVAASDKECFLQFDLIGPQLTEDGNVEEINVLESQRIVMSREMFLKLRDLIDGTIKAETAGVKE